MTPHYHIRANRIAADHRSIARDRHDRIARQLYRQAFGSRPGLIRRNIHWIASALLVTASLLLLGASI